MLIQNVLAILIEIMNFVVSYMSKKKEYIIFPIYDCSVKHDGYIH